MSAIDLLDGQLLELRRHVAAARALCYTGRPEEVHMVARHEAERVIQVTDTSACSVHVKRADGLDVEVSGSSSFVTATLERVLTVLGVIQAPPA